jgi:hypothetical protein
MHLKQADGNLPVSSHRRTLWQNVQKAILVRVERFSRKKVSIDWLSASIFLSSRSH